MSVISGIAVATRPEHVEAVRRAIEALPWAEIHYAEPGGRLVATIEADTTDQGMDRLLELKKVPHVAVAEMVTHVCEDETRSAPDLTSGRAVRRLEGPVEDLARRGRRRADRASATRPPHRED